MDPNFEMLLAELMATRALTLRLFGALSERATDRDVWLARERDMAQGSIDLFRLEGLSAADVSRLRTLAKERIAWALAHLHSRNEGDLLM